QLRKARTHLTRLFKKRSDIPKRVEVRELGEQAMVKLATERKHLTDIIKMVAYQAESELIALMRPHYARIDDEGRTLLHELFATAGDIRVSNSELQITLAPPSSPHRTLAAQALCDILNKTATVFPGSSLRMRFAVHPPRRIGLAFAGSPGKRGAEKEAVAAARRGPERDFLEDPMSGAVKLSPEVSARQNRAPLLSIDPAGKLTRSRT